MSYTVEQLLVTLGIDAASVSVAGQYVLILRDPQPDETNIPAGTNVSFTLVDLDADPTDPTLVAPDLAAYIAGGIAVSRVAGIVIWSGPWTGTITGHALTDPFAFWRVDATQVGGPLFESEEVVPVSVEVTGTGTTFDYDFTVADFAPPRLLAVEAVAPDVMRVTFDDDMALTGAATPLDVSLWANAILRQNVDPLPGVTLEVTAVEVSDVAIPSIPTEWTFTDATERLAYTPVAADVGKVAAQQSDSTLWLLVDIDAAVGWGHGSWGHFPWGHAPVGGSIVWAEVEIGAQFDLTMQWEMTPGCPYQITANPLFEDESGNPMNPLFSAAVGLGYVPEVPEGRAFSHWRHMIPAKNRREDATQDLERFSNCVEEILGWALYYVDHFVDQWDPDLATDEQIEAMLYDMGNPFSTWTDLSLTPNQKRKLLRILIDIYKSKGTAWGIEQTVYFLLGEIVTCVEYMAGGWILGVDALGSGMIAEVMSLGWDTWDFTTLVAPWELEVEVDEGATQTITFDVGHFSDPTAATAPEVVAAISAQLVGGGAHAVYPGQTAAVLGTNVEPFAINPGDTLQLRVGTTTRTTMFTAADIGVPGAALASEIAAALVTDWAGTLQAEDLGGALLVETVARGVLAELETFADPVAVLLGLGAAAVVNGTDFGQVAVHSNHAGTEASIQVVGGSANDLLLFDDTEIGSTGGAVLAPDDSYTLYSFDIETENVVTSAQEAIIRKVATYMKPAHTHLIRIRTALTPPWPDGWVLGVDELDISTELAE